ncbi:MAG: hypothetical protein KDC87_14745, partial [Planctomycetes bacterium]|nr:hypothetical protein [Planctomycetota bacterium]
MLLEARMPFALVADKLKIDVPVVLGVSVLVEIVVHYYRPMLPPIPVQIPAFLGTAIALILSFKLSQSYDRWWEARKVWGAIVNDSRTLTRQVLTFPARSSEITERIGRRQIAFCYCLGQSLRGQDWTIGAADHLEPSEREAVARQSNRSLALLQRHAEDVRNLAGAQLVSDYQRIAL